MNHNQHLPGPGGPEKRVSFELEISFVFTFFQAPAAPTLSFCPRASSSRRRGIPTTTSISRKGRIKAPEENALVLSRLI